MRRAQVAQHLEVCCQALSDAGASDYLLITELCGLSASLAVTHTGVTEADVEAIATAWRALLRELLTIRDTGRHETAG